EKQSDLSGEVLWSKIILNWHLVAITSLLLFLGGFFQVLGKKIGWYFVMIYRIYSIILWTVVTNISNKEYFPYHWIGYETIVLFLLILAIMLSKTVRAKYQPNKKSLLIILLGVFVLIIDRFLI